MKRPAAVILDMDGLMLDTETFALEAWQAAAAIEAVEIPRALCIATIGLNQHDTERFLEQELGPGFPFSRVKKLYVELMGRQFESGEVKVKPGLRELLDFLDAHRIAKAVATSAERVDALRKLGAAGILKRFQVMATSDRVANGKPAPDLFLLAASELDVPPACCTVLEDSEAGIVAAHAAGMRPLMVPDLKPPSAPIAALAFQVLASLTEVRDLLMREHALAIDA